MCVYISPVNRCVLKVPCLVSPFFRVDDFFRCAGESLMVRGSSSEFDHVSNQTGKGKSCSKVPFGDYNKTL